MGTALSDTVAKAVLIKYESLGKTGKPKETEFSVLAGLVLEDERSPADRRFTVIAVATGTKCLGAKRRVSDGSLVHDSHAEVLVRRSLVRLLGQHLRLALSGVNDDTCFLEASPVGSGRYRLKSCSKLHLYVSDSPCGDASIYPTTIETAAKEGGSKNSTAPETVDCSGGCESRAAKKQKVLDGSPVTSASAEEKLTYTGAKPLTFDREDTQQLGQLRLKSGRSNLRLEDRTQSMSCSDKLARWCLLGLQGRLLHNWIDPVTLASITISSDPRATSCSALADAISRAIPERAQAAATSISTVNSSQPSIQFPVVPAVYVTSVQYEWGKAAKSASVAAAGDGQKIATCGFSINWSLCCGNAVEVTLAVAGRKQGKGPQVGPAPAAFQSVLCKKRLFEALRQPCDASVDIEASTNDTSNSSKKSSNQVGADIRSLGIPPAGLEGLSYFAAKSLCAEAQSIRAALLTSSQFKGWPPSQGSEVDEFGAQAVNSG